MNKRKLPRRSWLTLVLLFLLIPAALILCPKLGGQVWYLTSLLIIVFTLCALFLVFESRRPQARELVVLAVLSALAVASRAAFAAIPHFKPMTAVIMITGIAFGPEAGFLTGAVSGFVSNFLFGQGPWTPWQMFAYGVGGFLAGLFARLGLLKRNRIVQAVFGFAAVMIVVGPLLDTCALFTMTGEITAASASAVYLSGVPVNAIHGAATALTMLLFANPLLDKLERLRVKYGMLEGGR